MNEFLTLIPEFLWGIFLGTIFYGGLWWTVRRGALPKTSVLIFPISLLLRMSVALTGFYIVGHGDWQKLLLCFSGFMVARLVITRITRPKQEVKNAPQL